MRFRLSVLLSVLLVLLVLAGFVVWPDVDLVVSGLFGDAQHGFALRHNVFLNALVKVAFYGSRALAVLFFLGLVSSFFLSKGRGGKLAKPWIFLLLALLIGPGLIANVTLKDHWGRARPRDVEAFGGTKPFTPALVVSDACSRNCSFVSGDAAFGFFLTTFAYIVPLRARRRFFWSGVGLGVVFGGARVLLGAHFLSDVFYAAALVMAVSAALHAALFGAAATGRVWLSFFKRPTYL